MSKKTGLFSEVTKSMDKYQKNELGKVIRIRALLGVTFLAVSTYLVYELFVAIFGKQDGLLSGMILGKIPHVDAGHTAFEYSAFGGICFAVTLVFAVFGVMCISQVMYARNKK